MLPECRSQEHLYTVPRFEIVTDNIEEFAEEFVKYHETFQDCFARSETRKHFFNYMIGQFGRLERKSIEPIAINTGGKESVRSMQRTIADAVWDEEKILHRHQAMVNEEMGDAEGVLTFDESGIVKKGNHSAGVSRQYCGSVGKVENCQVGVYMGYASQKGYGFLDKRLFMPEKWFTEEYEERWKKCQIPDGTIFKTKPELAAEMLLSIVERNAIQFKYILADSIYGNSPVFIEAAEAIGTIYMVSMPFNTLFWFNTPVTRQHEYQYQGQLQSKTVLDENGKSPITFKSFADNLNDYFWYKRTVSEGTKGPIEYEFTKRQITLAKNGLPWINVWLIVKRTIGDNPEYTFYISNAPVSTKLKTFVWLSGLRWSIEQCIEECKDDLGMDHYEVRKFNAWNRHMLITILAHFFLWHIKITLEGDAPSITLPQIKLMLSCAFPLKALSKEEVIDLIRWIQIKNHRAYLSHRKKKIRRDLSEDDRLMDLVI